MQSPVETALRRMAEDLDHPALRTHHLSGKLAGFFACSCGYDCRIVFTKASKPGSSEEVLLLVVGGKGGGRPEFARGAGKDASKLSEALREAEALIQKVG